MCLLMLEQLASPASTFKSGWAGIAQLKTGLSHVIKIYMCQPNKMLPTQALNTTA